MSKQHHHQQKPKKRPSALATPLTLENDNQILTFFRWCQFNGISERTGRRILASGKGPTVTKLSDKRIGVSIANNRTWQQSRERV
jgi:hypothetical protein